MAETTGFSAKISKLRDNVLYGGMNKNDKKFLSFDLYLKQNENNKKTLKELKELLMHRISTVANNIVYFFKENDFEINKKK